MRLGPFELGERLGKGGMGTVWRAIHGESGAVVAVKVLTDAVFEGSDVMDEFRHEVRAASRLDHPGIVDVYDAGRVEPSEAVVGDLPVGCPYLVMEYVDGGTLRHAGVPSDFGGVRRVLLALLDALAHAHARRVIHRDVKPLNVLVTRGADGLPDYKLTDFGIAHALDPRGRAGHIERQATGTAHYVAPEQILGRWREQGPWTDLYALGCLAFQLTTGRPPFVSSDAHAIYRAHLRDPPPPFVPWMAVPEGFDVWLARLLVKRPERRATFAADAMLDLLALGVPVVAEAADVALVTLEVVVDSAAVRSGAADETGSWGSLGDLASSAPTLALLSAPAASSPLPGTFGASRVVEVPETWLAAEGPPRPPRLPGVGLGLFGLRRTGFVGRETERDRVWAGLRRAVSGRGLQIVVLEGEAGVGKTRLAEWCCERIHELGVGAVLEATHNPAAGASDGLGRMLANHLRCADAEPDEVVARVERWFEDTVQAVAAPVLRANLLDMLGAAAVRVRLSGDGQFEETAVGAARSARRLPAQDRFAALTEVLALLGRQRPVVMWLDDLQWGAESIAFCEHLAGAGLSIPLLVIATVRTQDPSARLAAPLLDGLFAASCVERVCVPPMDATAMRALLHDLLALAAPLVEEIVERAQGYPRFAVEIVSDSVRRGLLRPSARGFELAPGAHFELPEDLQEIVGRRLLGVVDAMGGDVRAVWAALEAAAVLGLEVDMAEWVPAARRCGFAAVGPLYDRLVAANVAVPRPHGFAFASTAFRDALLEGARVRGTLAARHAACAAMLELGYGDDPTVALRVGRHHLAAGSFAEAAAPLERAARAAVVEGDFPTADTALAALQQALDGVSAPPTDARRQAMLALRAWALSRQARLSEATELLGQHPDLTLPGALGEARALALHVRGYIATRQGRLDAALADYAEGQEVVGATGDPVQIERFRHFHAIALRVARRVEEAEAMLVASVRALERLGMLKEAGTSHMHLAMMAMGRGELADARYWLEETERLYTRDGYRLGLAYHANTLGELERRLGDWDAALASYTRFGRLLRELGSKETFVAALNRGYCLIELQRHEAALEALVEARDQAGAVGATMAMAHAVAGIACVAGATGDGELWDQATATLLVVLARGRLFSAELSTWLERGAAALVDHGDVARARAGLLLVRGEWSRLGDADAVGRVNARLVALDDAAPDA